MLVYVVTVATSAFFVPHYLSIFWEPLKTNPWDIVAGAIVIVILVDAEHRRRPGGGEALDRRSRWSTSRRRCCSSLLGFFLVFSPTILVDNIHWGVAPTWSNLALAIPVAMLAYTGVETVSNLAEEAREPVADRAGRLQARRGRGLRDLPDAAAGRALGAAGEDDRRPADDAARAPARGGRLRERPDPRARREPRHRGIAAARARDLRRHPRRDDPLHRHERRRDRRLADHLLDGELPADPRGLPPAAPAVQDAGALARALRRDRADPDPAPGRRELRRHALLVRRDALVHGRARVARAAADEADRARPRRSTAPGRTSCSGASSGRSSRSSAGIATGVSFLVIVVAEPDHALGRPRLDRLRARRSTSSTGAAS